MRNRELTPAQKEYRRFDTRRVVTIITLVIIFVAILINLAIVLFDTDTNAAVLLFFLGCLIVYAVITVFVCCHLSRKHEKLYTAAYGSDTRIVHTGLFGKLWEAFERNQYEGLTGGKVVFAETHNNTIDLQILRKKHEFLISIDPDGIYLICDEETDTPIEKEIPLSRFQDVREVFSAIRDFVESC